MDNLYWLTCVLWETGAVAVALSGGDAVRAHRAPVWGESSRRGRRLALTGPAQRPLAGVSVPGAVGRLDALPGHGIWKSEVMVITDRLSSTNAVHIHVLIVEKNLGGGAYSKSVYFKIKQLTRARPDVWHVNQRPRILDEGLVVQGHARAEVLRIHRLAELCVCHRDRCLVLPWKKEVSENNSYTKKNHQFSNMSC